MTTASANASFSRRLACLLYESLTVFAVLLVGFMMPQIVFAGFGAVASGKLLWAHLFIVLLLYFNWFWLNGGQTLPMKTWKIQLVSATRGPLRPGQALFRFLVSWPCVLFGGVGFFWALIDRDNQFLQDRLSGTRLIHLSDARPTKG